MPLVDDAVVHKMVMMKWRRNMLMMTGKRMTMMRMGLVFVQQWQLNRMQRVLCEDGDWVGKRKSRLLLHEMMQEERIVSVDVLRSYQLYLLYVGNNGVHVT